MRPIQRAAIDRALSATDPAFARRHLRLVAAVDGEETTDPLAISLAATLAVATNKTAPPVPPRLPTPGRGVDQAAARGGAVAVARFDCSLAAVATRADLPRAAVRRALTLV